jgi:hypothetical protein
MLKEALHHREYLVQTTLDREEITPLIFLLRPMMTSRLSLNITNLSQYLTNSLRRNWQGKFT